ncbi:unnamed protein product [Amoebophrya sp. A120]|nr:unnamed protein product [Amoebophrya sp. A120]|eukprot:GSA120T00018931001.1
MYNRRTSSRPLARLTKKNVTSLSNTLPSGNDTLQKTLGTDAGTAAPFCFSDDTNVDPLSQLQGGGGEKNDAPPPSVDPPPDLSLISGSPSEVFGKRPTLAASTSKASSSPKNVGGLSPKDQKVANKLKRETALAAQRKKRPDEKTKDTTVGGADGATPSGAQSPKKKVSAEEEEAPDSPAGPWNFFSIVKPEPSAKTECAYVNCNKCIYWPNPRRFGPQQNRPQVKHIVVGETGRVLDVEHFHPNPDTPYCIKKSDPNLHLDRLKPASLFLNEVSAMHLKQRPMNFWKLYRDCFKGDVVFCSKDCTLAAFDCPKHITPDLSDKGWQLMRVLLSSPNEELAVPYVELCSEEDLDFAEPVEGLRPLHLAVRNGMSTDFIRLLLEKGAKVDAKNNSGYVALHYAAMNSGEDVRPVPLGTTRDTRSPVMDVLFEFNCDLDAQTDHGRTALMWAAMNGNRQAVLWLIEHGANRNLREHSLISQSSYDMTARDWAERKGEGLLCMLFDDVDKAEARRDWAPGQPFVGRGQAADPDDRPSDLENS